MAFQLGAFQSSAFQVVEPVTTGGLGGFEMSGGGSRKIPSVYFKPLMQRIREAKAQRVRPTQKKARQKARVIEVKAAEVALAGGDEGQFRALMDQWLAQKPTLPKEPGLDVQQLFMAQVAMRVRQIEAFQQDEEEALIALLLH